MLFRSHLVAGNQPISSDLAALTYGQSITDACLDLPTTLGLLEELAEAVRTARSRELAAV